jgi:hypothetical protein
MSPPDPDAPSVILPIGDRQLERIQLDGTLTVGVRPVAGAAAAPTRARVRDLSLHGLLVESIPDLVPGTEIDIIDLEPNPIRATVVRQSNLGTHVTFVDHLRPRYTQARPPGAEAKPKRRKKPAGAAKKA